MSLLADDVQVDLFLSTLNFMTVAKSMTWTVPVMEVLSHREEHGPFANRMVTLAATSTVRRF
jgi:hypothetical protein